MARTRYNSEELSRCGIKPGALYGIALRCLPAAERELGRSGALARLKAAVAEPEDHFEDEFFAPLAQRIDEMRIAEGVPFVEREEPAPYASWCADAEPGALGQMSNSMRLPSAIRGALMPDAHQGYGLPIGGVLATEGTVVPYAVGVDIACRMRATITDLDPSLIDSNPELFERALLEQTFFGMGGTRPDGPDHDVLDKERWSLTSLTRKLRDKGANQLGSSGGGNHFVEFGVIELAQDDLGLKAGRYVALLSHSGSRGPGAMIADHYTKLAQAQHPQLPPELKYLAWLDLGTHDGDGYMAAMELMGDYAAACHEVIHREVLRAAGATALTHVENHHNFCIPGDALIQTPGGPIAMADLSAGDLVFALDEKKGLVPTRVTRQWKSGVKPILRITTRNRVLHCSPEHPVLVASIEQIAHETRPWMKRGHGSLEWRQAGDLSTGDIIICAEAQLPTTGSGPAPDEARLLGAFLGDGWGRADTARQGYSLGLAVGSQDESHTAKYLDLCRALYPQANWRMDMKGHFGIVTSSRDVYRVLDAMGVLRGSRDKRVPRDIFTAPASSRLAFLAGYIDADGSVANSKTGNHGRAAVASVNEPLVRWLRELAISCGMRVTNCRRTFQKTNFAPDGVEGWRFVIHADDAAKLDLWHEGKRTNLREGTSSQGQGLHARKLGGLVLPEGTFAQSIRSIEALPAEDVFDITVDHPSHSFVCEGVVVHNCWLEEHDGRMLSVHRKGATPAGEGVLGVIPGSMAAPGFIVRGKGNELSLASASHGAGRLMSRTAARQQFTWASVKPQLEAAGVRLLGAGIDENPFAYKDIHEVMAQQTDLVDIVGQFNPRIVRMADDEPKHRRKKPAGTGGAGHKQSKPNRQRR